jgi:hypothetical protein
MLAIPLCIYRVIHKSLRDFRRLRYSSRDGHDDRAGGGGGINRGRDAPSFCGSVWHTVGTLRCTVTIDSVLANCKTQDAFLFPVHAMFRHGCPLAVKPASTPRRLLPRKTLGQILYLLICSFLLCLSWLLRCRFRKFRKDLRITLYNHVNKSISVRHNPLFF